MNKEFFLSRRFIVTGLIVLFSVLFLGYFTQSDTVNPIFQMFLISIAIFLVVPVLYCKIVLREPLSNLGWQPGKLFAGIFVSMIAIAVGLGSVFALSYYTSFEERFLFPVAVESTFIGFVLYEALLVPFTVFLYEVFFRGFLQKLWLGALGIWAALLQAGVFVGLLYLADDLSWQRIPALIFAPLSGLIVYYSGSLWYSWAASFLFFFLTDIFLLIYR